MENINIAVMIGEKFQCESCDYISSTKSNLKRHVKHVHLKVKVKDVVSKKFKCEKCEYMCVYNCTFKQHIKAVHEKLKEFKCDKCDYSCALSGTLKTHIKGVHEKIKDIKCTSCTFQCSTSSQLRAHIKAVHDKIKDFVCTQCEFKSSTNSDLKIHIKRIHDNPKTKNMSRGEASIFNHLLTSGYEFDKTFFREVTFNDLRGISGGLLRYDFKVMIDDVKFVLIEFDGGQHFKPVKFHATTTAEEALANYKQTRTHDRIKNDYCSDNGIALLRIKYDQALLIGVMITEFIRIHS
jgi:uncharacterized Zn-finger protein